MFSACTFAGGGSIVSSVGQSDLAKISADVQVLSSIAESKLKAFDRWLLTDCEFGEASQPQLDFDLIERRRMLSDADPYLFGNKSASFEAVACGPLIVENAKLYSGYMAEDSVHRVSGRKLPRKEVPAAEKRIYHEQMLQSRAREMQRAWAKSQTKLQTFLVRNEFDDVGAERSSGSSITYPLHIAAAQNNLHIVQLLLMAGADPFQLDSNGHMASQVAERKNKDGSHDMVLGTL